MGNHSKQLTGAAVTSATRATTGTIKNETGRDAVITAIEAIAYPTLETIVNSGGLVEFENGSIDIVPCKFYIGGVTALAVGAVELKPDLIKCHLPFPKNSSITVYYTPQDDQSQKLAVVVHFSTDISYNAAKHTWIDSAIGTAITQSTIDTDHITYDVPAAKGGILRFIRTICWGTVETVVNSGGMVAAKNIGAKPSWEPQEWHIIGVAGLEGSFGQSGGAAAIMAHVKPVLLSLPPVSKIQVNYTPQDDQSQKLSMTFIWTRS